MTKWTVAKIPSNVFPEWEYHDQERLRAILQKRPGKRGWTVHRIDSRGRNSGCDSFKSRADAHRFITNGRIFG